MRSYQILQFQWLNSNNCNGSPNVMYSINVDSLEDTHPRINQSWPGMLTMQMRDAPYGTCGIAAFSVNDQCCSQSLDTSRDFSNGYLSGRPSLIDTADIMTKMPLGSNGHQYCNISHIGAVTNYNFVALLADDTVCIDEYYRCFSNHSISVYSDSNCLGSSNNYILPDTHQSISGLGEGSFIEIKGGKSTNSWITYVPGTLAVAPVGSINGIVQNCAFVISFTSDVVLLYYLAKKASKGVTIFIYCGFVTQTLWVCHIMVYYYFWRVPLPYRMSSAHLQSTLFGIVGTLSNLATLCTTNFTLLAIHHISKPSAGRKRLEFIFLWIFHILLGGML
ncbi:hypothetical protein BC833DRAFT_581253 [Globomyces pollinis-pini]|nr:hypothetical protein BC833DRAFT_581253 [Globomyces pollinis-pini]